jgi:hypothetical protein
MERISGPIRGHYLAAYTVASPEGWFGYAKVCTGRPESAWDGTPVLWKVAAGPFPLEDLAMARVLDKAEGELREASDFQLLWVGGTG